MDKEDKMPKKKTGAASRKTGDNTTTKGKKIMPYDSKRRKRGKSANSNFLEIENIKVGSMTYEV